MRVCVLRSCSSASIREVDDETISSSGRSLSDDTLILLGIVGSFRLRVRRG